MTTSPLKWHGGTSKIASKIVGKLQSEVFAGGLSVLFAKPSENYDASLIPFGEDFATPTRENVSAYLSAVDGLPDVVQRLRRVQFLLWPETLFYLDPPYLAANEMAILSGCPSDMYSAWAKIGGYASLEILWSNF